MKIFKNFFGKTVIVVVRRELDSESLQSQSTALEILFSLVGPILSDKDRNAYAILGTQHDTHWPCGSFLPFEEDEAESLGDGLIDHSAKEKGLYIH